MTKKNSLPTIAALATAPGTAALHIIRVSGKNTYSILSKLCKKKIKPESHTAEVAYIYDESDKPIDQVVLVKYVVPNSYTGEDLIEINCHGNMLLVKLILELLVAQGAEIAQAGDFSKRAFLNSKIDLNQVSAILNLTEAKTQQQARAAVFNLQGSLSKEIERMRKMCLEILAPLELNIDYPPISDFEGADDVFDHFTDVGADLHEDLEKLIKTSKNQRLDNLRIIIVGRANAGKSSLLNALLNYDRVIVSDIAGTTRDTVEVDYYHKGHLITFVDTAGIHESDNQIEKLGIERSLAEIKKANLIIHLIDATDPDHSEDIKIKKLFKNKKTIKIYSKADLLPKSQTKIKGDKRIFISSKTKKLEPLLQQLDAYLLKNTYSNKNGFGITSKVSIGRLTSAIKELETALDGVWDAELTPDLVAEHVRACYDHLSDILGLGDGDLANDLFDNFCVGK